MKRIMLSLLLCGASSLIHTAGVDVSTASGEVSDIDKEAQAWVNQVLKEFSDKLDRLIILTHLNHKGFVAYGKVHRGAARHRGVPLAPFSEAMKVKVNQLLSKTPATYPDIEVYYSLLYKQSGIPQEYMISLTGGTHKKLPDNVKTQWTE